MTNAKKPATWPHLAAGCRDEAQFLAKGIQETAKQAQLAVLAGQSEQAIVLCGDIRDAANSIVWQMVQAATGHYEDSASVGKRSS